MILNARAHVTSRAVERWVLKRYWNCLLSLSNQKKVDLLSLEKALPQILVENVSGSLCSHNIHDTSEDIFDLNHLINLQKAHIHTAIRARMEAVAVTSRYECGDLAGIVLLKYIQLFR